MTIYFALLIIALIALLIACLFMYLEIRRFGAFGSVRGKVSAVERPAPALLARDEQVAHLGASGLGVDGRRPIDPDDAQAEQRAARVGALADEDRRVRVAQLRLDQPAHLRLGARRQGEERISGGVLLGEGDPERRHAAQVGHSRAPRDPGVPGRGAARRRVAQDPPP